MLESDFWQNKSNSKKIIKEKKLYEDLIKSYDYSVKSLIDLQELNDLAVDEKNQSIINEVLENIKILKKSAKKMKQNVFYQMKAIVLIVILKFMQVQGVQKAKIGLKC